MAGLYIHIPFCASRCIYCGFYSTTRHELRQKYVDALCHEIALQHSYLHEDINTIYIGGGTPSLLTGQQLQQLFNNIDYSKATEITIECNPDDITNEYADIISRLPINRVSMGAQTFSDRRLQFIRRRHKANDVTMAISRLRAAGIENISIDLMYGFPDETLEEWKHDISCALALDIEHISAYSLMFEEGTALEHMRQQNIISEIDEELNAAMYEALIDSLTEYGYEHYEISNFARPRFHSRHNSSYWKTVPYLGIGAAAHSFNINSRQWNIADIDKYIEAIADNTIPCEREILDSNTRYNDTIMLSLRTCEGINLTDIENNFGRQYLQQCMNTARQYISTGLLECTSDNHLRLTRRGLFVSDMIMSDMMKV